MASVREALQGRAKGIELRAKPYATASVTTPSSVEPAIEQVRWEMGGKGILFLGTDSKGLMQLERLDMATRRVEELTDGPEGVGNFDYRDGGVLFGVYVPHAVDPATGYPMAIPNRNEVRPFVPRSDQKDLITYSAFGGATRRVGGWFENKGWVAPGGRWAVTVDYPDRQLAYSARRFVMVDLLQGRVSPVLTAQGMIGPPPTPSTQGGSVLSGINHLPFGALHLTQALWSDDGRRVILLGVPLPHSTEADSESRDGWGYLVDYDVPTERWRIIEPTVQATPGAASDDLRYASRVSWGQPSGKELLVTHEGRGRAPTQSIYVLRDGTWVHTSDLQRSPGKDGSLQAAHLSSHEGVPASVGGILVFVRQSANEPPELVASLGKREIVLTDPDPALKGIWRARVEPFEWQEPDGTAMKGELALPRNSRPAAPLPLVIQLEHDYDLDYFLPDGHVSGNYAMQSFVARGFAVAKVKYVDEPKLMAREGPAIVERIDAVISTLSARGLIDPARVGVTGHSRLGFQTFFAITHPGRWRLAAAVVADSFLGSYPEYLREASERSGSTNAGANWRAYGGDFWEHKVHWLDYEPTFNVDRVRTPALFTTHGPQPELSRDSDILKVLGAFRANQKPVEYLDLPQGNHYLLRPREQVAEMEATIDWMSFWLQGKTPSNPELAQRWEILKEQQQKVLAQPEKPPVKWVAVPITDSNAASP